jgi:hypothetical protein
MGTAIIYCRCGIRIIRKYMRYHFNVRTVSVYHFIAMITVWSICFNYLIYKPQLPDANSDSFVLVNLSKGATETAV